MTAMMTASSPQMLALVRGAQAWQRDDEYAGKTDHQTKNTADEMRSLSNNAASSKVKGAWWHSELPQSRWDALLTPGNQPEAPIH